MPPLLHPPNSANPHFATPPNRLLERAPPFRHSYDVSQFHHEPRDAWGYTNDRVNSKSGKSLWWRSDDFHACIRNNRAGYGFYKSQFWLPATYPSFRGFLPSCPRPLLPGNAVHRPILNVSLVISAPPPLFSLYASSYFPRCLRSNPFVPRPGGPPILRSVP